jgi:MscS family membrane protein
MTATLGLLVCVAAFAQIPSLGGNAAPAQPEVPKDSLGRTTPRGTVLGFLAAAQKGDYDVAAEYLNTRAHGKAAADLAHQLSVVLDQRLPARLNQLSDKPEGSGIDPLNPNRDLVGTVSSNNGNVSIFLDRVDRGKSGEVWLFSSKTLESIPEVYEEIDVVTIDSLLPEFLLTHSFAGIPLYELVAVFIGLPVLYLLTVLLNRILRPLAGRIHRRLKKKADLPNPEVLPRPVRLLVLAILIRWLLSKVSLPLLARQFWANTAVILAIAAIVWILILLNGRAEDYASRRLRSRNLTGTASVLRLARRVIDLLLMFGGVLAVLYIFGVNPTAALAGLGVGGIAVALAAQKTLENVIGGVSVIFDQVIRVGDTVKVGDIVGTVEEIGLRSTQIRTNDRTLVSVPNGQIATMNLETLSARDKFWFHPLIGLRYGTSGEQIQAVLNKISTLLTEHPSLERSSIRVRFLGFGDQSLDIDIFAYVYARDWNDFLRIQEGLLFSVMEIIREAGTKIALPARMMYIEENSTSEDGAAERGVEKIRLSR